MVPEARGPLTPHEAHCHGKHVSPLAVGEAVVLMSCSSEWNLFRWVEEELRIWENELRRLRAGVAFLVSLFGLRYVSISSHRFHKTYEMGNCAAPVYHDSEGSP